MHNTARSIKHWILDLPKCGRNTSILYVFLYFALASLVYLGGFADNIAIPEGRETLIVETLLESPALAWHFAAFVLTLGALNLLPLFLLLASMRHMSETLRRARISKPSYFLLAIFLFWAAQLTLNKLYFPRSAFALLIPIENPLALKCIGVGALAAFLLIGVLPAFVQPLRRLASALRHPVPKWVVGIALIAGVVNPLYSRFLPQEARARQPDIILIGLDSFSPQHMQRHPGALPTIEGFLRQAAVFDNTLTPLARTFPAWTSILTAKYPVNSGARFNLTAFNQVDASETLPRILKARGYTTIYAQDERKFNNINEHFGFDKTVGPRPGAAEFVLAKIADMPIVNLVLLTPLAQPLFPFVALNRASAVHYDPTDFVEALVKELPIDPNRPLFLAAHFCLAHHPYTWRTPAGEMASDQQRTLEIEHIHALKAVDKQLDLLLESLKAAGRLDNAVIVLLSDHGESMAYEDGLWISENKRGLPKEVFRIGSFQAFSTDSGFSGHGSNVLDRTQYQPLLAFKAVGPLSQKFPSGNRQELASLVDIMPTIVKALDAPLPPGVDGIDLMSASTRSAGISRIIPTETGIRFNTLSSVINIDEDALLAESKEYYRVDADSARLIVKPELYPDLVATKDIALHTQDWMLAFLRKDKSPHFPRVALLVHKPSGAWTMGQDKKLLEQAPIDEFRQAARDLYGKEMDDFSVSWVFKR